MLFHSRDGVSHGGLGRLHGALHGVYIRGIYWKLRHYWFHSGNWIVRHSNTLQRE